MSLFEETDDGKSWLADLRAALVSGDPIELAELMESEEVDGWLARAEKSPELAPELRPEAFLRQVLSHPLHRAAGMIECLEWVIDKATWRRLDPVTVQQGCSDPNLFVWLVESARVQRPKVILPLAAAAPEEEARQQASSALALWLAKGWIELAEGADPDAFGKVFDAMLEAPKNLIDRLLDHPDVEEVFATDDEVDQFLEQW